MINEENKRELLKDLIEREELRQKETRQRIANGESDLRESAIRIEAFTRLFERMIKEEHRE